MTVPHSNYLKNNWLTISNLILLLTLVWNVRGWQQSVDKDIEVLKKHTLDVQVHMPLERKIEVFVPRVEIDARLRNIETMLTKIDDKINK